MKILDFPDVKQAYEYDCGASSLQAVFEFYGLDMKEGEVMKEVKTSQDGTNIADIERAVKKHGFQVDSREMSISDVKAYINKNIPVIILLQAWSENEKVSWKNDWKNGHFVVAIGYDDMKMYFEDPYVFKRTSLTYAEFKERWHDVDAGKRIKNHGVAIYGKPPAYDSKEITPLG